MSRLSSDLILHIATFSNFVDLFFLRQVAKRFNHLLAPSDANRHLLHNDIVRLMDKRLQGRVPDVTAFRRALVDYKHSVAGSFPVQCILNQDWSHDEASPSDIDVFFVGHSGQDTSHCTFFMRDAFNIRHRPFYTDEECKTLALTSRHLDNKFNGMLSVVEQREGYPLFPVCQRKYMVHSTQQLFDYVMIDQAHYATVMAYFSRTCDFAFTAVLFDGQRLRVRDWDALRTRSCRADLTTIPIRDESGYQGYPQLLKQIWRARHRAEKYLRRGFQVELVLPNIDHTSHTCAHCHLCQCGCQGKCCLDDSTGPTQWADSVPKVLVPALLTRESSEWDSDEDE